MKSPFILLSVLFVSTILMETVYSPDFKFLGIYLTIDNIFLFLFFFYIIFEVRGKVSIKMLDPPVKYALYFMLFYLFALQGMIIIKEIVYEGEGFSLLVKRLFRNVIIVICMLYVIKYINNKNYRLTILKTIFWTLVIVVLSSIFSDQLLAIGFIPRTREITEIKRNTGFLGLNPNEAALFYNMVFGFSIAELTVKHSKRYKKYVYLIILMSMTGVLLMVSKTGLAVLILILLLFFYKNVKISNSFLRDSVLLIGISLVVYFFFGESMKTRVGLQFGGKQDTFSSRMHYNDIYLEEILDDRSIFLLGRTDQPRPHEQNPHNFYVYTFYYGGVILLSLLLFISYKLLKFSFSKRYKRYAYVFLPILIGSLAGFGGYTIWFLLVASFLDSRFKHE